MMLHGIGSEKSVPVVVGEALAADPGERFDVVLANPPFGKKSSTVIVGEDGRTSTEKDTIERDDFWATTDYGVIPLHTEQPSSSLEICKVAHTMTFQVTQVNN